MTAGATGPQAPGSPASGDPWQVLPALDPEDFAALRASIAAHGVLVPVEVDQHGEVLDGHHRLAVVAELVASGVAVAEPPRLVRAFDDTPEGDAERLAHVVAVNLVRRHLDRSQRSELVARLREQGWSVRRVAAAAGVGVATVARDLARVPIRTPSKVTGSDGRTYPATRRRRAVVRPTVFAPNARTAAAAGAALDSLGDGAPPRVIDVRDAVRLGRTADYAHRMSSSPGLVMPAGTGWRDGWEIRSGDFTDTCTDLPEECAGLVLTDPPYGPAYAETWSALGAFAARVLAPEAYS